VITEIEVKFVDVDIDDIRERLENAGATLEQPMRLMRRVLIEEEYHKAHRSFIRVRDEGDKTTITFKKRVGEDSLTSAKEVETTVGDFDTIIELFKEAGWNYTTYQESKRETWRYKDVEVVIDEWPWINPYVEIEGPSEESVRTAAGELKFDWDTSVFGSVDVIYQRDFPDMVVRGIIDITEAHFGDPIPEEFGKRRR
jgi:adenylate cyclase class 2